MKAFIVIVLALWFAAVAFLGSAGAFVRPAGTPPVILLFAAVGPIVAFLIAYWIWPTFRRFVLGIDPRLAAATQAWRAGGLTFLALYAHGLLPGAFAWPAGLGDIAIGTTAPWVVLALIRRPAFASSPVFVAWNWLGILDLIVAVSTGGLHSMLASPSAVSTGPMATLPLVLIPAYLVPIFVMLHLAALIQARRLAVHTLEPQAAG